MDDNKQEEYVEDVVTYFYTMKGNPGTGFAKITHLTNLSSNAYLTSLTTNQGAISPEFYYADNEYSLTVPGSVSAIELSGTTSNSGAKVSGFDKHILSIGENKSNIVVCLRIILNHKKIRIIILAHIAILFHRWRLINIISKVIL